MAWRVGCGLGEGRTLGSRSRQSTPSMPSLVIDLDSIRWGVVSTFYIQTPLPRWR